ncbi:MAG TPA: CPBP family intramembrane glutamic endopeptidase [Polyangiaceae bacterium]|nr:CPBP family intramembrane glutamic endopeptidase [Polyangiaceae bacterium]
MTTPKRPIKLDPRARLRDTARVVGGGAALFAVVQTIGAYMAQNHTGAVVAQVVVAELGTGWLGVTWSDPLAPMPTAGTMAKRALRGAAFGAAASVILVGASVLVHAAKAGAGSAGVAPILMGLFMSAFVAARDELLLRGLPLRALGKQTPVWLRLLVCGLAAGAFRFGAGPEGVSAASVAFSALSGSALGALWIEDRGVWLAWGANAAFTFVTGTLAQGTLIDVTAAKGLDASLVAIVCGVFFAASGAALVMRSKRGAPSNEDGRGKGLQ